MNRRAFPSEAVWAPLSQALNMGGNMLVGVQVARSVDPDAFGAWSTAYLLAVAALATFRSSIGTTILVSKVDQFDSRCALTATVLAGSAVGAVVLCVGGIAGEWILRADLLAFGACIPVLVAQDAVRQIAFGAARAKVAAESDAIWLGLQTVGFAALSSQQEGRAWVTTAIWGCAGLVGGLHAARRMGLGVTRLSSACGWLERHKRVATAFGFEGVVSIVSTSIAPIALALIAGLSQAGALRGALICMGAFAAVSSGLVPVATVAAKRGTGEPGWPGTFLRPWALALIVLALLNGATLTFLGPRFGDEILGETWPLAAPVLIPLILQTLIRSISVTAPIVLRVTEATRLLGLGALINGVAQIALSTAGTIVGPALGISAAEGAAYGILTASAIGAAAYLVILRRR